MKKSLYILFLIISSLIAEDYQVKISKDIPYVDVKLSGQSIRIHRIQDTGHKLTDDFTKTSRVCPPFCVQPIRPVEGVKNIAELELIKFIKTKVANHKGLIIDARTPDWYKLETIPTAINVPFTILKSGDKKIIYKLFTLFGVKVKSDGSYDFSNAKELAVFCNGLWCAQSPTFIRDIVKYGYPKNKIYYYRSGMQGWKLLGLTTEINKKEEVK